MNNISELEIKRINKVYNYAVKIYNNTIYIESKFDTWYIEKQEDNELFLFHKNKKHDKRNYHRQKGYFTTINQIFKYIEKHDRKQIDPKITRNRIDKLLMQINCR